MNDPLWLHELLLDPEVTDICINGGEAVFVDRGLGLARLHVAAPLTSEDAKRLCLHWLAALNRSWDARYPFIQIQHPTTHHRIHIVLQGEGAPAPILSIRRTALCPGANTSSQWSRPESPLFLQIQQAFSTRRTVLISGATGSGKTTFLNELLHAVPEHERILALEDLPELSPAHPGFLRLVSRIANADGQGAISLRQLVRESLRMRPDRLIMGECRGAEAWDFIQLLNTGHRGSAATLHANTPRDALRRLELLAQLSQGELGLTLSSRTVREFLANGIDWIVQLGRVEGVRRIIDVQQVVGLEGDTILLRPVIKYPSETRHETPSGVRSGLSSAMGPSAISRGTSGERISGKLDPLAH